MAADKEIKFKFIVDQTSLNQAKGQIEELVSAFGRLRGEAQRAVAPIQGVFTGLYDDKGRLQPATEKSEQKLVATQAGKVTLGGSGASISNSLTKVVNDHKNLFKGMAQGGKEGMDSFSRILKGAISEQTSELNKLENKLKEITGSIQDMQSAYNKAMESKDTVTASKIQREIASEDVEFIKTKGAAKEQGQVVQQLRNLLAGGGGGDGLGGDGIGGGGGGGGGWWSKLRGAGGGGGGVSLLMNMLRGVGVGRLGLGTIGLWGAKQIGREVWEQPNLQAMADARYGQAFGQRSLEMRGGEFRNIAKEQEILSDPTKREEYKDLGSGWRRALYSTGAFLTGRFGEALTGRAADISVQQARQERIQLERQENPLLDQILGEAQNYQATLSKMRALGVSARPGSTGFERLAEIRKMAPTFSEEEIISAKLGIESAGTRRGALALTPGVLQAQAAGISGIAQSAGAMSIFGAGVGSNFLRATRQYAGGGVDPVTAGLISQAVAQQQSQFGMATSLPGGNFQGAGLMSMLMTGAADPNLGKLIAQQNLGGVEYLQRSATGQTSPYQMARNLMIAGKVAPGLSSVGQSYLARKMDITEIADAMEGKGGDVNAVFRALGGTKEQAKSYMKEQTKSLLEGVSFAGLQNQPAGKLAKLMIESGADPREFFKKKMWKGTFESPEQAIEAYAGALQAQDANMSASQAMGLARTLSGVGAKGKAGALAGDSAGGSPEARVAAQHVELLGKQAVQAASALDRLMQSANALSLRQELEASGLDFNQMNSEQRLFYNQALSSIASQEDASIFDVRKIEKELETAWAIQGQSPSRAFEMIQQSGVLGPRPKDGYTLSAAAAWLEKVGQGNKWSGTMLGPNPKPPSNKKRKK